LALADHSPCRRRPGRLADRRLMQAAIDHRATPSGPRDRGLPDRGQPDRQRRRYPAQADRALATKAAAITVQLLQARDGASNSPPAPPSTLPRSMPRRGQRPIRGQAKKQKNPFQSTSMAWAAWIIARLGAGTVPAPQDHRGPSSSSVASITSTSSLWDRPSEMCPLHSPLAGAHRLFCGLLPFLPLVENSKIPSHPPNRQDGFRSPGQPRA